jgi:hypothetical protein
VSTHVGIVVLLCLFLIFALIRYRSSRAAGAGDEAKRTSAKRTLTKPTMRLGRGSRTTESEPPRQRRHRPRLGLTVSGVPTEEALLNTSAADATSETLDESEQSVEASDAAILELAGGAAMIEAAAPSTRDTVPDDAAEEIPVSLRGVVQDDAVIEAPGWPQPGELGPASATDGFVAPVIELEPEFADHPPAEAIVADEPLAASTTDDLIGEDVAAQMWEDQFAGFDPASGWGSADEDPAEPAADDAEHDWDTADVDATFDDAWALPQGAGDPADEAFADDAAGLGDEQDWSASEWDFATVAAAPPIEVQTAFDEPGPFVDREFTSPPTVDDHDDEPTFSWSGEEVAIDPDDEFDLDPVSLGPESTLADPTHEVPSPAPDDAEATLPAHDPAAWEAPPTELPDPPHDTAPAWTTPVAPQKAPKVDERTRQLEKRLAAVEAELKRIAKRTKSKKGDLRKAGKDKIAKQVRKAIGDPALARHFDLEVGKGRFAFERRSDDLPMVTVGEHRPGEGSQLLAALEGPMRANLLAMLLRDYAHLEADRRVATIRSQGGVAAGDAGEFDALVARLAELSQRALLGIEPRHPRR